MQAVRGASDGDLVPDVLLEYGAFTRGALRRYLPDQEPRRYLYDLLREYPLRGGRLLRPSLCLATARAFGGRLEHALPAAASIELMHNAALIHDDVEDESEERRGLPTMHRMHGTAMAINAGDALLLLSLQPLLEAREQLGSVLLLLVLRDAERACRETAEGQALDLGWRREHAVVTETDYLAMVLKKTCWFSTIYPLRIGALLATRGSVDLDRFLAFGFFLGAAFQVQDDLLNLVGDHERYGKEMAGDLWEGKRTLMLLRLLACASATERAEIDALLRLSREQRDASAIRRLRRLIDGYGCVEYGRQFAHGLAAAAANEFAVAFDGVPPSRDRDFVERLVTWVLERT